MLYGYWCTHLGQYYETTTTKKSKTKNKSSSSNTVLGKFVYQRILAKSWTHARWLSWVSFILLTSVMHVSTFLSARLTRWYPGQKWDVLLQTQTLIVRVLYDIFVKDPLHLSNLTCSFSVSIKISLCPKLWFMTNRLPN